MENSTFVPMEDQWFDMAWEGQFDELEYLRPCHNIPVEILQAIYAETQFQPVEQRRLLPPEIERQVGLRQLDCPLCGAKAGKQAVGNNGMRGYRGETTGALIKLPQPCHCSFAFRFWREWETVPAIFRSLRLDDLVPPAKCEFPERMRQLFATAKAEPQRSYLLLGPPGIGKTSVAYALMREKLEEDAKSEGISVRSAFRCTAERYFAEDLAYKTRNFNDETTQPPALNASSMRAIQNAGKRVLLVLEEVDKTRLNDTRRNALFALINLVYEAGGQLIVTANRSLPELTKFFGEGDFERGKEIMRRITRENDPMDDFTTVVVDLYGTA